MTRAATALLALLLGTPAVAQISAPNAVPPEEIGSWRLSCVADRMTDRNDCLMRHRQPVEPATSASASSLVLEVQDRGGRLVPIVAARDLTLEGAQRGLLALTGTAQLRFPPNRFFEMPCGLEGRALVCAPRPEDAARAAEELAAAPAALVRVVGFGAGGTTGNEPVELRLERTRDALARYRARVPEGTAPPVPSSPGLSLPELLGRAGRLFGN
jgi:hypothetical protein